MFDAGKVSDAVTARLMGPHERGSVSEVMRRRRWTQFAERFPDVGEMHVLDVGGYARAWAVSGVRPAHLTLLNVDGDPGALEPWMTAVQGDACGPLDLGTFDLAFSNSVIEHVGGHWRRERLADLIRHSAPRHWVQTPNRYFPVEPHFLVPALQHLPLSVQARVVARWPVGHYSRLRDPAVALRDAMNVELLSRAQLAAYFPGADLVPERLGPLVKSWIAARG